MDKGMSRTAGGRPLLFVMTAVVQLRVPKGMLQQLDALAQLRLRTRSDIVREALLAYVKDRSG